MRLLRWLIGVPLAVVVVAFAIANRGPVTVSLDPLPFAFSAPLFAVAYAGLFVGVVVGVLVAWLGAHRLRVQVRRQRRQIERLESELARLRKGAETPSKAGSGATAAANPPARAIAGR